MAMMHPDDVLRAAHERLRSLRTEVAGDRLAGSATDPVSLLSRLALLVSDALLACGWWLRARAGQRPASVTVLGGRWEPAPLLMLHLARGRAVAASAVWWPAYSLGAAPLGGQVGFALVPLAWLPGAHGGNSSGV
jgi:hypothetical protein